MRRCKLLLSLLMAVWLLVILSGGSIAWANTNAPYTPELSYDGRDKEFIIDNMKGSDLFTSFKDVVPGDEIVQPVILSTKNISTPATLYLKAEFLADLADLDDSDDLDVKFARLMERIEFKVYQKEMLIAESSLKDAGRLSENILIYRFESDEEIELKTVVHVPETIGNELEGLKRNVRWTFTIQEDGSSEEIPPKTGDDSHILWYLMAMAAAGAVFTTIGSIRGYFSRRMK